MPQSINGSVMLCMCRGAKNVGRIHAMALKWPPFLAPSDAFLCGLSFSGGSHITTPGEGVKNS